MLHCKAYELRNESMYMKNIVNFSMKSGVATTTNVPDDGLPSGVQVISTLERTITLFPASANCPLRKPCATCETLRNEKPIYETLRKFYLRKLAKTCICETLRILRNKRKTAKLEFAKPCETRICETCETRFAKLGETLRNTNCENRESCEN